MLFRCPECPLTVDQKYWLDRRAEIIDALKAEGLEIWSDRNRVWLHRASSPSVQNSTNGVARLDGSQP